MGADVPLKSLGSAKQAREMTQWVMKEGFIPTAPASYETDDNNGWPVRGRPLRF